MIPSENNKRDLNAQWIFLARQVLVSSGVWVHFFMFGLCMGTPTIYISQIRRDANSTDVITEEMSSWLSSTPMYSSVPNLFVVVAVSAYYGPTKAFLTICITSVLGFLIMYFSTSVIGVLAGEVVIGALIASDCVVCIRVLTEYISPQYRGSFLVIKSASFAWGMLIANLMGTFLRWKSIPLLGCALAVYAFVSALFWPDSPYWLASKQKYTACTDSHNWLKGQSIESVRELESLIAAHDNFVQSKTGNRKHVRQLIETCYSKALYKAFGYAILLLCLHQFSGKIACNVYALQIIKTVTNSESTTYIGMLENKYIFLTLLSLYMISVSCGPVSLSPSLIAELCPLRNRNLYMFLVSLCGNMIMATVIKLLPLLFASMGSHGAFMFYGSSSLFFIILITCLVPETKDKSIIEMDALLRN
ncbi:facilitated trehalose transporter Tret1-like [Pieris rapae]|uniref:facilitated trehalose transporter Tret1-like n=1 Tax=Pieris rapae TaxID=64459 RepID=UPI001E27CB4A|nr:facilitated trehalose transporter Tret1-like [Pieris rapae]